MRMGQRQRSDESGAVIEKQKRKEKNSQKKRGRGNKGSVKIYDMSGRRGKKKRQEDPIISQSRDAVTESFSLKFDFPFSRPSCGKTRSASLTGEMNQC